MNLRSCCWTTLCLVGSLVCLSVGSYCFAGCFAGGPTGCQCNCLMGWHEVQTVAGSYSDGTPVCTSWSQITCLNLYMPEPQDNNGLQAVAFTPSIEITASYVVGDEARDTCQGSPCDGCPPATAGGNPGTTGGTTTSYRKFCCGPGFYPCP